MTDTPQAAEAGAKTAEAPSEPMPTLPPTVKDAKATRELLFTLRHFHLGDPSARDRLEEAPDDLLPALLDQFRDTSRLRYDYPLLLFPPDPASPRQRPEDMGCPFSDWLRSATTAFAPEPGSARILRDHFSWLEGYIRDNLSDLEGPVDAHLMLDEAGAALLEHLHLRDSDHQTLAADLDRLSKQPAEGSRLLRYGRHAAIHLLIHCIRSRVIPRRERFRKQIEAGIRGLRELIEIEWTKSDESIEPRPLRDSVGPAGNYFDAAILSSVMDHCRGGTLAMSPERRERINKALAVLEAWKPQPLLVHFVHTGKVKMPWSKGSKSIRDVVDKDPCGRARTLFDEQAQKQAEIFSALRIAQLEIGGIYDPAIHDPWFANFNWEAFSQDELLMVPSVVAVESADRVAGEYLRPFSRLLSSGRPVQILMRIQAYNNPSAKPTENPFHNYRIELGYFGISHRQAVVNQSSPARHEHLLTCLLAALDATRTGLHIVNTGLRSNSKLVPLNAWLIAGAAIESRAHPFFRINPAAGDYAAARMDFSANPQPEVDWPLHPFRYLDENGIVKEDNLAFTFADYALLIDRLRDHFRVIPTGCDSDALVPIQEYLSMDPSSAYRKIPFVWAVDGASVLHRLVVSRELTLACLDRLNFWHTLQEMAGVRNRYVELAIEHTRSEERSQAALERERLLLEHRDEVERVRSQAAGEAMQRLTDMLLGLDLTATAGMLAAKPASALARPSRDERPAAAPSDEQARKAEEPAVKVEEEELGFDEPWVDTPLCTSCNDCMKVNPLLFVYNEDKQAMIGDFGNATYAQIVEAAELCPAQCIHPGKPWNPNEPGLDEMIRRAAPYNQ